MPIDLPIDFVLVEPSHPGNIGAAARAIKTMGFRALRLVAPRVPDAIAHADAIAYASNADDVLRAARVFSSLEDAVADATLVVGVSARTREFAPPMLEVDAAATLAIDESRRGGAHRVALVFGTERIGLTNEQAQRCHRLTQIDAEPEASSLNLAQAVQVVAHELRRGSQVRGTTTLDVGAAEYANHGEVEQLLTHLREACVAVEFIDPEHPKKLFERLRRLFARTRLEREEVQLLRGLCKQMILKLHGRC